MKAARVEAQRAVSTYTFAAVEARKLAGDTVPMDASPAGVGKLAFTLRLPVGIVGAISPFNFPLNLVAHKLAPALAAGCAVVLKPASQTPMSALLLAELEQEAGLPAGWLNVVCGSASEIGDVLVGDERVALITFTGSGTVGWGIRERAPRKRVSLELGNATPVIVEPDADLDEAAAKLAANAFSFAGQSCISVQRIYVHRDVRDAFLERFLPKVEALKVGDPADEETDVGPVIAEERARPDPRVDRRGAHRGAEILAGGEAENGLIRPTVIAAPPADAKVACEEVFGPVVTVDAYGSIDEAIERANGDPLRPAGRDLHGERPHRPARRAGARVRRRDGQRGADVPRRPDALRRREGLRQHPRGPRLRRPRDDGGAGRRPSDLAGFDARVAGNHPCMIGVAFALVVLGILGLFVFPWGGAALVLVGLILLVLFLLGIGRRTARQQT